MKVLHLFSAQVRGGAEEYVLTLAQGELAAGWDVHVACPTAPATAALRQEFQAKGATVHALNIPDQTDGRRKLAHSLSLQVWRGLRLLRRVQPDRVQINLPWPDHSLGLILACACLNIPTIVTFHLIPHRFEFGDHLRWLYAWARSRNQQWLSISQFNCQKIAESFAMPLSSLVCIPNGTRLSLPSQGDRLQARQALLAELQLPDQTKLVLTVGRLAEQKGYGDLVPCIPPLLAKYPDLQFVWVGEGPLRPALETQLRQAGVRDRVRLLGYRQDVSSWLAAADLFVFPTHFEGHPLALLEAMNAGTPIVTTGVSSIPEVMQHAQHGLVCEPHHPQSLLESLQWALLNPEAMARMAQQARHRVLDFSEARMLSQTLELLAHFGDTPHLAEGQRAEGEAIPAVSETMLVEAP